MTQKSVKKGKANKKGQPPGPANSNILGAVHRLGYILEWI